jgi:hypothetical protein
MNDSENIQREGEIVNKEVDALLPGNTRVLSYNIAFSASQIIETLLQIKTLKG